MTTPANRVPVRVARGYLATLQASVADLYEGEVVYAVDEQALYLLEGETLIPVAGTSVGSVNGQTGNVILGVGDLDDVTLETVATGDTLLYVDGEWVNSPATSGGTVLSIDVNGTNGITATGGPVTSTGVIEVSLDSTGVAAGEYTYPTLTVDEQGRITAITSNTSTVPDLDLDDLQDVDAPFPGVGDGLKWDGSKWVSSPDVGGGAENLTDLNDVELFNPLNDQDVLTWNQQEAKWTAAAPQGGGGGSSDVEQLSDLLDVRDEEPDDGQYLRYDGLLELWRPDQLQIQSLNDIDDVSVGGKQNGDQLVYDEQARAWVAGNPQEIGGAWNLTTKATDSTESPLLGGDALLGNDTAAWISAGFTQGRVQRYEDTDVFIIQSGHASAGATLYDGRRSTSMPRVPLGISGVTIRGLIQISSQGFHFVDGDAPVIIDTSWTSPYDYLLNGTEDNDLVFEVTLMADDIRRFQMELYRCRICPSYLDPETGQTFTVYRRELVSAVNGSWGYATELWISEEGSVYVKQGTPTFSFTWTGYTGPDRHGIFFGQQDSSFADIPSGHGDGTWVGLPSTGSYVNFCGYIQASNLPQLNVGELLDTELTSVQDDDILVYDSTTQTWKNEPKPTGGGGSSDVEELSDLNDVSSAAPQTGEALIWNGSIWEPGPSGSGSSDVEEISDLTDVDTETSAPQVGQLLAWDGSNWVPADAPVTGATELNDLTDVNLGTPPFEDTAVLSYDRVAGDWDAAKPRAYAGAPTQTNFPGVPGEMRFSADYFYICIAADTWKKVALSDIDSTPQPPEIGDIADGGDFLNGIEGTIDTILDGGNWTTGATLDEQDKLMDGGLFTPDPDPVPGPDDIIDGGDFEDGTAGTNFKLDGGDFITGAPAGPDFVADGGLFTSDVVIPGPDDIVDGGDFEDGTPGTDFAVDGGNWTTGAAGGPDVTLDGGDFTGGTDPDPTPGPDDTVDGGNWTDGTPGTDFRVDGGDFTTGAAGTEGIVDGGDFSDVVLEGPTNGGNFTTGVGGADRDIIDGGDFSLGYVIEDIVTDGGDFTNMLNGEVNEIIDGGEFLAP